MTMTILFLLISRELRNVRKMLILNSGVSVFPAAWASSGPLGDDGFAGGHFIMPIHVAAVDPIAGNGCF